MNTSDFKKYYKQLVKEYLSIDLWIRMLIFGCFLLLTLVFTAFKLPKFQDNILPLKKSIEFIPDSLISPDILKKRKNLENAISDMWPKKAFLVVNTTQNKFKLYKGKQLIREGLCSTGSFTKLESHDNKQWIFKTPKGVRKVLLKTPSPIWRKPDWAFVEEGLPIPSANSEDRFEHGVLGNYALILGDGYMIHGTLYKRFIGQPVTHGCIRMLDDDLEETYKTLQLGSRVYIY